MSGTVVAAGVPFLGPAVAAWIALIVGVMAFYFLSVSRQYRARGAHGAPEWPQSTPLEARLRNEPTGTPWGSQADRGQLPQLAFRSDVRRADAGAIHPLSELPAYDMENYPDEKWGSPVDNTASVSWRDHA
jgi:hypothetical protein